MVLLLHSFIGSIVLLVHSDADYTIFVWRQQQQSDHEPSSSIPALSTPTLHLHNPSVPLPDPPAYLNAAYYVFQPSRAHHPHSHSHTPSPRPHSSKSRKTKGSKRGTVTRVPEDDGVPKFKKEFEQFHAENGVRTVVGSIGPVQNGVYGYSHHLPSIFDFFNSCLLDLPEFCLPLDQLCAKPRSPDALKIRLPSRLHLSKIRHETRLHPRRRRTRTLRLRRPCQHRDMAHNPYPLLYIHLTSRRTSAPSPSPHHYRWQN